jgi:argininosuccinate lyase
MPFEAHEVTGRIVIHCIKRKRPGELKINELQKVSIDRSGYLRLLTAEGSVTAKRSEMHFTG